jgi:Prokaryotic E2 family E
MSSENRTLVADEILDGRWVEDLDAELPEAVISARGHGRLPEWTKGLKAHSGIRELPDGKEVKFVAGLSDTLRQVFEIGAHALGKSLLPPGGSQPLDILRCRERNGHNWSEPLTNLEQPLWLALAHGCTRHFGIEYVLAVKINTRWGIAPSANATPRELLTSFGFDPTEFSLYRASSADLLPPDTPLSIKRGDKFEAQKDGRYGAQPTRGLQTIEDDLKAAQETGINARLFIEGGQKYIEARDLAIPSPPWSRDKVSIIVAIPATYPTGGLDAFYVEQTVAHANGSIPYQKGTATIDGRPWALISWHYATNRPWNQRQDNLASHIEHCRGYFLKRGVSQ